MARAYTSPDPEIKGGNNKYIFDPAITPGEAIRTTLLNRISWGAVFAGVVMAFAVQLTLNLVGAGIGLVALDSAQEAATPAFSWTSIAWWTISGIIGAFVGGFTAGRLAGEPKQDTAAWHGLISWAASVLVITVLMASAAGAAINMGSPFQVIMDQGVVTVVPGETAGAGISAQDYGASQSQTAASTPAVDADALSAAALVSAAALLIGACAALCGGLAGTVRRNDDALSERRESVTFQ